MECFRSLDQIIKVIKNVDAVVYVLLKATDGKNNDLCTYKRGCQIFLLQHTKTFGKILIDQKIFLLAIKYTKWLGMK
jgi:hypothetical protein